MGIIKEEEKNGQFDSKKMVIAPFNPMHISVSMIANRLTSLMEGRNKRVGNIYCLKMCGLVR